MVRSLYNTFVYLYPQLLKPVSLFNGKAKRWIEGRKQQATLLSPFKAKDKIIWFHAASVGEFEQGLPVMKAVKTEYPKHKILLTFFSPSGFEAKKNTPFADLVLYMPMDSKKNAETFIHKFNPTLAVFVKYEFWFHYLHELKRRNVPVLLISAVFRKDQPFFKWYGGLFKKMLHFYKEIFVQDKNSADLLNQLQIKNVHISGDTRFDRVAEIAASFQPIAALENIVQNKKVIVVGSSWLEDDELLGDYAKMQSNILFVVAPHETDEKRLNECKTLYPSAILFSELHQYANEQTIIINNVGMLSRLYHYGDITYVGGGFTKDGIHNTLEAAVHYKPVVFGPEYSKYNEAKQLIAVNGAASIKNKDELQVILDSLFANEEKKLEMGKNAGDYVRENTGASKKIIDYIQENRLLTN
jgi:3-deoxy-D-manno-octulosonic-acid transferase